MEVNNYSEVNRKLFHLLSIGYIIGYNYFPRPVGLFICIVLIFGDIIIEALRLSFPKFNKKVISIFKSIYRREEENSISGLVWTFTGAFLTVLIFNDAKVVNLALLYLVFGDSAAAIIGTQYGKIRLWKKSLEGSLSCLLVCFLCGLFFFSWQVALLGAIVAATIEFIPMPGSDNLWLPLLSAATLTLLKM